MSGGAAVVLLVFGGNSGVVWVGSRVWKDRDAAGVGTGGCPLLIAWVAGARCEWLERAGRWGRATGLRFSAGWMGPPSPGMTARPG